jgi:hypothetical protein
LPPLLNRFGVSTKSIVWSVLDWNETALRQYRSLGAVLLDEWTGYRLSGAALEALAG